MNVSQPPRECDVAVVGAGIVGLAVARELALRDDGLRVAVLEREPRIGTHQTGHSSGVIHAGVYYEPGSLKARLCVAGARELYAYCDERGIEAPRSGKLIVATSEDELERLGELERRGIANGVPGLRRVDGAGLREIEPHAAGLAALHSPETGIVDFARVAAAYAADLAAAGGSVTTGCAVASIEERAGPRADLPWRRNDGGARGDRLRRRLGRQARARRGRAGRAPHRALPRRLPAAAAGARRARAREHLPRARSRAPVSRRPPHARPRRRRFCSARPR